LWCQILYNTQYEVPSQDVYEPQFWHPSHVSAKVNRKLVPFLTAAMSSIVFAL
jgi:hypothetical protein